MWYCDASSRVEIALAPFRDRTQCLASRILDAPTTLIRIETRKGRKNVHQQNIQQWGCWNERPVETCQNATLCQSASIPKVITGRLNWHPRPTINHDSGAVNEIVSPFRACRLSGHGFAVRWSCWIYATKPPQVTPVWERRNGRWEVERSTIGRCAATMSERTLILSESFCVWLCGRLKSDDI